MSKKGFADVRCPLFPDEADVWKSLGRQTQEEITSLIGRLLAMYVKRQLAGTEAASNERNASDE